MDPASEEWELCNDDGFIYKRKKRRLDEPSSSRPTDPEEEERQRKERKRKALLKLKKHYQKEINMWELLSTTLYAMQEKTQDKRLQNLEEMPSFLDSASNLVEETETGCGSLVDKLILLVIGSNSDFYLNVMNVRVGASRSPEAIIHDVSNLCDVAEAMCNAQEEQLKQSFLDLPVWSSPQELMASLCDAIICDFAGVVLYLNIEGETVRVRKLLAGA
ncbi:uncharacterized protein LOC123196538 [Mangifera indica]|uniref:uncharacterized protein LOC123196538 n=1 Tax=Mangifera indica TaxID=29780 RepID=UPI001CFC33D7|nr:uncharacterized protein LOC123196538 [Mangifera indica]